MQQSHALLAVANLLVLIIAVSHYLVKLLICCLCLQSGLLLLLRVMMGLHPLRLSRRRRQPTATRQWQSPWPSFWASYSPSLSSFSSSSWSDVSAPLDRKASSTASRRMPLPPPHPAWARHASQARFHPGASTRSAQSTPSPAKLPSTTSCRNAAARFVAKLFRDKSDGIVWFVDLISALIALLTW